MFWNRFVGFLFLLFLGGREFNTEELIALYTCPLYYVSYLLQYKHGGVQDIVQEDGNIMSVIISCVTPQKLVSYIYSCLD